MKGEGFAETPPLSDLLFIRPSNRDPAVTALLRHVSPTTASLDNKEVVEQFIWDHARGTTGLTGLALFRYREMFFAWPSITPPYGAKCV